MNICYNKNTKYKGVPKMKFKIETLKNYQIMPTTFLKDKRISLKAKGLLATMYSLPNEWDYSINGLCKITNTGLRAVRAAITELEIIGYIERKQIHNEKGQFDYEYLVKFTPKINKNALSIKKTIALNK